MPLDGDPVHEPALTLAADLAAVLRADLKLLAIVPTWGGLAGPQATARLRAQPASAVPAVGPAEAEPPEGRQDTSQG